MYLVMIETYKDETNIPYYETRSIKGDQNLLKELHHIRDVEGYSQESIKTFIKKLDEDGLVSWEEIEYGF
ncbi:hypothetical protein [Lactococcus phage P1048]|uniref:Uncharacterized protein n=1 Tax=Lactococcus phage P1048 TaxID=2662295 RepID=A0A649V205_9CAUD|nr:hypothetical protein H1Z36_gp019 [Lactococcus phage P1048]QGJ84900.1 hypothetical protein [Lactococcus phage P1048]